MANLECIAIRSGPKTYALSRHPPLPPHVNGKTCRMSHVASLREAVAVLDVPLPPSSLQLQTSAERQGVGPESGACSFRILNAPLQRPDRPLLPPFQGSGMLPARICMRSAASGNHAAEALCRVLQSELFKEKLRQGK